VLSGIEPADELDSFGILVVVDLPVGTNLQDHPLLPMSYLTDESLAAPSSHSISSASHVQLSA
jgi:choline dehydrogenase